MTRPVKKKVQPSISKFFTSTHFEDATPKVAVEPLKVVIDLDSDEEEAKAENSSLESFKYQKSVTYSRLDVQTRSEKREKFKEVLLESSKRKQYDPIVSSPSGRKKSKSSFDLLTPLEQQFVKLKRENLDKVLAIQVGYKFKFFGEDAKKVHKILSIMLVPGKLSLDLDNADEEDQGYERIAYCSIPENRIHIHLKRLLEAGMKVGLVEQVEVAAIKSQSSNKSSLFERQITKVYTSGTYIDGSDLESMFQKSNNYILALKETTKRVYIVAVQLVSGEIIYDSFEDDASRSELETRLLHLNPSEFLMVDEISAETRKCLKIFESHQSAKIRITYNSSEDYSIYVNEFSSFFEDFEFIMSLERETQVICFEMIKYLIEFGLEKVFTQTENFQSFHLKNYMLLNGHTIKNLEIFKNSTNGEEKGSLLSLLDHTRTKYGFRTLKKWISQPLTERGDIIERQDIVESLIANHNNRVIEMFIQYLKKSQDLERALNRIHLLKCSMKEIYFNLQDINKLLELISKYEEKELSCFNHSLQEHFVEFKTIAKSLEGFDEFLNVINSHIIKDEYMELRQQKLNYFNSSFFNWQDFELEKANILDVEKQLDEELIRIRVFLKRPQLQYTKNNKEKYLIEVRNSEVVKLPHNWLKFNSTKSVSRFYTPEVTKLLDRYKYHEEKLVGKVEENFKLFIAKIDEFYTPLNRLIKNLSKLDALLSLASVSVRYTRPELIDIPYISLQESKNPIIEMLNPSQSTIPNDIKMDSNDSQILVITGPNMGGKSTLIKQIAISVIMTQIGCFLPAAKARMGIFTQIFIRMGSADNIVKGESTFQLEMSECFNILKQKDDRSLILLDEIGRGTSTNDGFAIAFSILNYLATESKAFVLYITHFNKLNKFEAKYKTIKNYHMDYIINGKDLTFLYKFVRGFCSKSYGINVARLTSIPDEIVAKSELISRDYEAELEQKMDVNWSLKAREVLNSLDELEPKLIIEKINDLIEYI